MGAPGVMVQQSSNLVHAALDVRNKTQCVAHLLTSFFAPKCNSVHFFRLRLQKFPSPGDAALPWTPSLWHGSTHRPGSLEKSRAVKKCCGGRIFSLPPLTFPSGGRGWRCRRGWWLMGRGSTPAAPPIIRPPDRRPGACKPAFLPRG